MVGTSGSEAMRLLPAAASARSLPSLISGSSELIAPMNMSMRPASRSGMRGGGAAERHMDQIDPGVHLEQFAAEMLRRADADRAEGQLVRRILGERDELLHGLRRQGRRHDHDEGHVGDQIDRREIGDRVVDRIARQVRAHGERGRRDQHEMAVRRRLRHEGIGDDAAAAGLVLDHGGLLEAVLQAGRDLARHHVVGAARRERHDDADGLVGKALRMPAGETRQGRHGDGACGEQSGHASSQSPRGKRHCAVVLFWRNTLPQSRPGCQSGGRQ